MMKLTVDGKTVAIQRTNGAADSAKAFALACEAIHEGSWLDGLLSAPMARGCYDVAIDWVWGDEDGPCTVRCAS